MQADNRGFELSYLDRSQSCIFQNKFHLAMIPTLKENGCKCIISGSNGAGKQENAFWQNPFPLQFFLS